MSAWHGPYQRGAAREARVRKRRQAVRRNALAPLRHGVTQAAAAVSASDGDLREAWDTYHADPTPASWRAWQDAEARTHMRETAYADAYAAYVAADEALEATS